MTLPIPSETVKPHKDVEYILLLGVDKSTGQRGRTDAILIVALNHATGHVGVISIPRDLYVDIPGIRSDRINTVVRLGNRKLGAGKGIPLLRRVIKRELGIPVSYTALVDFKGFVSIIDTLGGIDVDVKCPIQDCFYLGDKDDGCTPLSLTAGAHRLDGKTALLFARSRHGRSDGDRARRQQAVLLGLKKRFTHPGILPRLPTLWIELSRYIGTDLDLSAMVRIATLAAGASRSSVHGLVLKAPIIEERRTPDGKAVFELNRKAYRRAFAKLFDAPAPGVRKKRACPPADIGLHWRERLKKRKDRAPPPLVSQPAD